MISSEMKRFPLIAGLVTLAIVVGGVILFSKGSGQTPQLTFPPSSYEYYWGNGCPHCENVDKFFSSWEGKDKVQIDKKEVWYNRENAKIMQERANSCQIPQSELAVPFLVTPEGKCFLGDEPIIQFFKELKF